MQKILAKREKIILYTTIGIIVLSIIFNLLLSPVLSANDKLNKEISLVRARLKKYLVLLSQRDYIRKQYSQFSEELKSFTRDADTSVSALSELENLAKAADIRIIDIRPQAAKGSGLYKEALIDLRAEGTIENYLKFIYTTENSLLLLKIKKMQLNAKAGAANLEGIFLISQVSASE